MATVKKTMKKSAPKKAMMKKAPARSMPAMQAPAQPSIGGPGAMGAGGPMMKKGGKMKKAKMKMGGKMKKAALGTTSSETTKNPVIKDSSNIYRRMGNEAAKEMSNAKTSEGLSVASNKIRMSDINLERQSKKGKPGYDAMGFPVKKNKIGGTTKKAKVGAKMTTAYKMGGKMSKMSKMSKKK